MLGLLSWTFAAQEHLHYVYIYTKATQTARDMLNCASEFITVIPINID